MTHAAAKREAALTVRNWRDGPFSGATLIRIRRHIAQQLGCCPSWDEIEAAIALRVLAEDAG